MRRLRFVVSVMALMAGSLVMMAPAAAGPPGLESSELTEVICGLETDFGFVDFYLGAETFEEGPEAFAGMGVFDEAFAWEVIVGEPVFVEFGDGFFEAELELFETEEWNLVGMASAIGTYEQVGDFEVIVDERSKFGNRWTEERVEVAPIAVEGLLYIEVDGFAPVEHDMSECEGSMDRIQIWSTNPTAFVLRFEDTGLFCQLEQDGWFLGLQGFGNSDGGELYMEVFGPDAEYFGFTDQFFGGTGSLMLDVHLWVPGLGEPTDVAVIDAFLSKGEPFAFDIIWQEVRFKSVTYELIVEGTLTVPGFTFDMSECGGEFSEGRWFEHPDMSQGKGQVPANDLPDGATLLTNRVNDQTRMASFEPEAACSVFDDEAGEYFDLPIGKTVWYTVEGTGEPMTVDTAGSDFDTVIGLYLMEDDELVPQACIDDVFSDSGITTLAAIDFDSAEGETYFVQVGGIFGEYGHLKVAVR